MGAGLAVAIVCLMPVGASAAGRPRAPGEISGINANTLSELPASKWKRQLAAMSADGIQYVRSEAVWGTIEPQAPRRGGPVWRFSSTDAWVRALASHHLTWQPILGYNSSWALAVRHSAAFAAFGQAVAARYGANGSFWRENRRLPYMPVSIFEVWNEENAKPWNLDPISYASLYAATRTAIHVVDSQASVDIGGLADDSSDFNRNLDYPSHYVVQMMLTHPGLEGHVDGFALHPYGTAATDVLAWIQNFRGTLDQFHESSVPIDITEFGWVTGNRAEESWRAEQMSAVGLQISQAPWGLREVAPYDWINPRVLHEPGDFGFVGTIGKSTKLRPAAIAWFGAFLTPVSKGPPLKRLVTKLLGRR